MVSPTGVGTSLTKKRTTLGPYRRPKPRVLGGPRRVGVFMGEVHLYIVGANSWGINGRVKDGVIAPCWVRCGLGPRWSHWLGIGAIGLVDTTQVVRAPGVCPSTAGFALPIAAILCTGGPDVIRKEAWCFHRTISGVRLCWELEEPKGCKKSWDTTP